MVKRVYFEVLSNTPKSNGTIETVSLATAITEDTAINRVKRRVLLHNGYSRMFALDYIGDINVEVTSVEEVNDMPTASTYRIHTLITGV